MYVNFQTANIIQRVATTTLIFSWVPDLVTLSDFYDMFEDWDKLFINLPTGFIVCKTISSQRSSSKMQKNVMSAYVMRLMLSRRENVRNISFWLSFPKFALIVRGSYSPQSFALTPTLNLKLCFKLKHSLVRYNFNKPSVSPRDGDVNKQHLKNHFTSRYRKGGLVYRLYGNQFLGCRKKSSIFHSILLQVSIKISPLTFLSSLLSINGLTCDILWCNIIYAVLFSFLLSLQVSHQVLLKDCLTFLVLLKSIYILYFV